MIHPITPQIITFTVNTGTVGKQNTLPPVPAGMQRIPTSVTLRKSTADLSAINGALIFGFDAAASAWGNISASRLAEFTDPLKVAIIVADVNAGGVAVVDVGIEDEIFGCAFNDTSIVGTLTLDVEFRDVPA